MTHQESGMRIRVNEADTLRLDQHSAYKRLKNVRAVDFVMAKDSKLVFAEFKKSAPFNIQSKARYIEELFEKFLHSYLLFSSCRFGRRDELQLPKRVGSLELNAAKVQFILCVKDAPDDHVVTLQNAIQLRMKLVIATVGQPVSVNVINQRLGVKHGWLVADDSV